MDLVKRSLKEELLRPRYKEVTRPLIEEMMQERGLAAALCNRIYAREEKLRERTASRRTGPNGEELVRLPPPAPRLEELSVVVEMRDTWAAQLHATLARHLDETGLPLMCVTSELEGGRAAAQRRGARGVRWLYTVDDLLDGLEMASHPNHTSRLAQIRSWCLTPVQLSTPSIEQLRDRFAELAPTERQVGLDDELRSWFVDDRLAVGLRLLETGYMPFLRQYAKSGVPAGLRARVWHGAMRLEPLAEREYNYYAALRRELTRVTLATDEMVRRDAASPSRAEEYFVFSELVTEILLAFCRDPAVSTHSTSPKPQPIASFNSANKRTPFPPSGAPPGSGGG